jgi:hypothetical protein
MRVYFQHGGIWQAHGATAPVETTPTLIQAAPQTNDTPMEVSRIEMEATNFIATNPHFDADHRNGRIEWHPTPYRSAPVLILYGTVTGNAESLAHKLAEKLSRHGVNGAGQGHGTVSTERPQPDKSCVGRD